MGQTLNLMIISMGLLMLVLWCKRRKETVYGYFGLSSLAWGFITANLYIKHIPISTPRWEALIHGAYEVFVVFLAFFALRYAGRKWKVLERLLWVLIVASPISLLLTGPDLFFVLSIFWHTLSLGMIAIVWIALVRSVWHMRKSHALLLGGTGVLNLVLATHDWLVHTAVLPYDRLHLLQTGAHSLFFVIGWLLIDRFVQTLDDYEQLNGELEIRVAEEHAEIEKSFARLRNMEQEQAVLGERERIMRDMHDGMGSRLMTGVHMVEQGEMNPGEVTDVLRECLDELRMMVDSLEPMENDLLTVMGNLRYRLEGRLKKQGVRLEWKVTDVPPLDCLTAQNILHVLRILQEMFTNILKHAKADTIRVETEVIQPARQTGHVIIHVHDNGVGFNGGRTGRGMKNMQKRAEIIGGCVEIKSAGNGTLVSLFLPVSEDAPSA